MQMLLICILVAGAYLTGRFVTKSEYEEKFDDLRTDHDTLKRAFNKLIQEEEELSETKQQQSYWEVEDEFHNFNHTE
jgi:Tfp pilus assembly protein PilO